MRIPLELRRRFLMGGLSRREYEQYKADAKKRIWDFKRRHSLKKTDPDPDKQEYQPVPGFPNLLSLNIAEELEDRVNDPESINQKDSSLCGAASVMFCWLRKRPDLYVQYVINVCETGVGKMGDLLVTPKAGCRYYNNKRPDGKLAISAVDWIALAALRDSENGHMRYDSADDQVAGITMPSKIAKWFKNIGYYVTGNETNLLFNKGFSALREAAAHLKYRESVCLFINANVISEAKDRGQNVTPNHWVVMMSEPMIDGQSIFTFPDAAGLDKKTINFKIFTWGGVSYIKNLYKQTVTVKEFLSCFRGFISAEYPSSPSSFEFKVFSWWIQHHGYNHNHLLGW